MDPTSSPGPEPQAPPEVTPAAAPAGTAPAASTSPAWLNTITSTQTLAGAAGLTYADIPSRIFADSSDAIILAIGFFVLFTIFGALFFTSLVGGFGFMSFVWLVVLLVIYAAGSAIYFIYTWTKMRGSPGQRILGMETLNAADGSAISQPQAVRRWLFLFGPFVVAQVFSMTGWLGVLGTLLGFLGLVWAIYLLYTAANSPKRQGFHDVQAETVVVKIR